MSNINQKKNTQVSKSETDAIERLYRDNPLREMPRSYKGFTIDQHIRMAESMVNLAELASYMYRPQGAHPSGKMLRDSLDMVDDYKRIIAALRRASTSPVQS